MGIHPGIHAFPHIHTQAGTPPSHTYPAAYTSSYKLTQTATHLRRTHLCRATALRGHTCLKEHTHPFAHPDTHVRIGTKTHLHTQRHTRADTQACICPPPPPRCTHVRPPAHAYRRTHRSTHAHTVTNTEASASSRIQGRTDGRTRSRRHTHRLHRGGRALLSVRIGRPRERSPLYIPGDGEGRGSLICLNAITPGFIVPAP